MDDGANSTLSIAKVGRSDSGNYSCSIGPNDFYTITVHILNGKSYRRCSFVSFVSFLHFVCNSSEIIISTRLIYFIYYLNKRFHLKAGPILRKTFSQFSPIFPTFCHFFLRVKLFMWRARFPLIVLRITHLKFRSSLLALGRIAVVVFGQRRDFPFYAPGECP